MKHKRLLWQMGSLFLVVLLAAACGPVQPTPTAAPPAPTPLPPTPVPPTPTPVPPAPTLEPTTASLPDTPRLVSHPAPALTVPADWLEKAGCTYGEYDWDCTPDGPVGALGCEQILIVHLLGGLSPAAPLVECFNYSGEPPDRAKFKEEGCMRLVLTSHLLFKDDAYQLVNGADELRPLFAPVESADEALSYALAATNLYARYGQEIDPDRQYLVDEVEDTHVDETPEGYLVHLFSPPRPACGCAIHTVEAVDVLVTRDGQVTETNAQPVYEFGACID